MALLGFKSFLSGDEPPHWTPGWTYTVPTARTGPGRFPGSTALLAHTVSNSGGGISLTFSSPISGALIVGLARIQYSGQTTATSILKWINSEGDSAGELTVDAAGFMKFGTAATASIALSTDTWNYIEVKVEATSVSIGYLQVRLNGVEVINFTGDVYTANGSRLPWGGVIITSRQGSSGNANALAIQDIYVADSSGPAPYNDFLGDSRVERLIPSYDVYTGMVGSDGDSTDNYLNVANVTPSLTVYNGSDSVGGSDEYGFTNLSAGSSKVHAVQVSAIGTKQEPGVAKMCSQLTVPGFGTGSGPETGLGTGFTQFAPLLLTKTPNGSEWTAAKVNDLSAGVMVTE